jgi:EmrB/QacA subfamily drug resistance transporter
MSAAAAVTDASRTWILSATIVASSMAFIDSSVVTIALPAMQRGLGATLGDMQWVSNAYLLLLGSLILVGGGLGDRVGRRLIVMIGIAVFAVASILCAAAPTVGILIVARLLQGIGAALLVPQSLAIISATYPKEVRGRAIGTWAAAASITTALGPPLGGFLVDLLSWRVVFWINVPLAAIAIWLTFVHVPENKDEGATGPIDWLGAAIAVLAFGALTYGLTAISDETVSRSIIVGTIVVGLAGIALFVYVEGRAANPIMPPELFRLPVFTGTNIVTLFLYGALAGMFFLLPFDLQARRGLSASAAGLTLVPIGIIIGVLSRQMGSLADRLGPRPFLVIGPVLVGLCGVGLALNLSSYWIGVLVPVLLFSVGMAIVVSPLTTAVMNSVPDARSGAASGVNNAASRLAGVLAIAVFGAAASLVFNWNAHGGRFGVLPAPGDPSRPVIESAFLAAYSTAMGLAALWCFIAALAAHFSLPAKAAEKPAA